MQNVELLAAETLLEKGVPLPIRPPLFFRLFGLKTLKIYQPTAGNKLRISELYLKMSISDEALKDTSLADAERLLVAHTDTHCRIIAIAMFKGFWLPILLNRIVGKWLKWNLSHRDLAAIAELLILFSGTQNFMSTTRYIGAMRITAPNLGQRKKGS